MRVLKLLLISGLLIACQSSFASNGLNQDQRVGEGLMLILKGEKVRAWEVLFPEAKAGNEVAMFHLGTLMIKSPEYPDNLERAEKFFKAAADRGHKGSKAMLVRVQQQLATKQKGTPPSIAGFSGQPTQNDLNTANKRVEQYKAEVLRFTGLVETIEPKVEAKLFTSTDASSSQQIYDLAESVKLKFGEKVKVSVFVVIDPSKWSPGQNMPEGATKPAQIGFTPDFKGAHASEYGVRQIPAVVLVPSKGRPRVISDPRTIENEISNLL